MAWQLVGAGGRPRNSAGAVGVLGRYQKAAALNAAEK